MENGFNAAQRKWISELHFAGVLEIPLLKKHGSFLLKPEVEKEYERLVDQSPFFPETMETDSSGEPTESRVKVEIDALGDSFFGFDSKKRKRKTAAANEALALGVDNGEENSHDERKKDEDQSNNLLNASQWRVQFEDESENSSDECDYSSAEEDEEPFDMEAYLKDHTSEIDEEFHNYLLLNLGMDVPSNVFQSRKETMFPKEQQGLPALKYEESWHSVVKGSDCKSNQDGTVQEEPESLPGPSRMCRNIVSRVRLQSEDLPGPSRRFCENEKRGNAANRTEPGQREPSLEDVIAKSNKQGVGKKETDINFAPRRSLRLQEKDRAAKETEIETKTEAKSTQSKKKPVTKQAKKRTRSSRTKKTRSSKKKKTRSSKNKKTRSSKKKNSCETEATPTTEAHEAQQSTETQKTPAPRKEDIFFQEFLKRSLAHKKQSVDPARKHVLRTLTVLEEDQFEVIWNQINTATEELLGAPVADVPICEDTAMPLLAPPIPKGVLERHASLAIYVNVSNKPGSFQWSCKHTNDQTNDSLLVQYLAKRRLRPENAIGMSYNDQLMPDAIFSISFYNRSPKRDNTTKIKEPELAVKLEALGSQTLRDLREYFFCETDLIPDEIKGDTLPESNINPSACAEARKTRMDRPCGVFVGDTMYTNRASKQDRRYDYAQKLQDWHSRNRRKINPGPFQTGNLEDTKLIDLKFKPGFPYLFIHEGNCEHLLVIENVRVPDSTDLCYKLEYPLILTSDFKPVYCYVDNKRLARYAVRRMRELPQDPMLLCYHCLKSYCYSNNKKVSDFELYPYLQLCSMF